MKRLMVSGFVLAALAGCAEPQQTETIPYQATSTVHDFMVWGLEPAADVIWDSAGFVLTEEGEIDLQPTTQEGWDAVRNAAAVLAESGNLLQIPGHSRGADWNEISAGMTRTSVLLIKAAENKNDQEVFDYGGQLYNVCVSCHQLYMLPEAE